VGAVRFFSRLSFRSKINLGIIAVVLLFGLLSAFLVSRIAAQAMLGEIKKRGWSLGSNLTGRAADPMLALDFLRLKKMVDEVKGSSDDIVYAFIQDVRGQVLSHTFKTDFPVELKEANLLQEGSDGHIQLLDTGTEQVYDFALPVMVGSDRLGTVRVGLSQAKAHDAVQGVLLIVFGITAGAAVVAMILGTLFAGTVTRRLNILRHSAEEMVRGNLDLQTGPQLKRNCWEIMECEKPECPAYENTRHRCWYLAGTLCPECAEGGYEKKITSCEECRVYKENVGDEIQSLAEAFDFMALSLNRNIEELKEAESNLIRQQQLLKTILDVTPDLVSLQDEKLAYRAVNPAFCQFFALQEKDIIGKTDLDIFPRDEAESNQTEDLQVLRSGAPLTKEMLVSRNNHKRWLHMVKMPVYDQERVAGLLFTARDISELKRYQEQLVQSVKMEQMGKLAGGVAHEINTPLAVILGYAQMLLEDLPQDSESHEFLEIIEKQAQICRHLVGDLLGFSRQMESKMAEMDLNQSIEEVVHLVKHPFKQSWVDIEASLDPRLPPITGDMQKLKQVWINLLNNAYDSIGEDGAIWVRTKLCPQGRRVLVTVADTGSGISSEDQQRIFEPFFTTKAPGAGTGLGLSVTFGIIQDHLGKISAVSPAPPEYLGQVEANRKPAGPGTVFLVELPVSREEPLEDSCEELFVNQATISEQTAG
jgi:two-component system NtrC family sensor kinase